MNKGLVTTAPGASWTQNGLHEYLLAVQPGADIHQKVLTEKELLYQLFHHKPAADKPHIPLASFHAREDMEATIIRYMHRICSNQQGFQVALNNYSGIPPHTIYLRVQNHSPFQKLANELKSVSSYISSCACPPIQLHGTPHLTIAKKLPASLFEKALMEYAQKTFHETFTVNELVLLRRQNQYDPYKPVNIFKLQPATSELYN
ncbi:2'-5' RNA ligase family protein [Aridibaculum aurantiacum]|uniref:2'-5' RNA ligase family protein n=1 Tax=Aridibaculum aurantiacum TaxID=2810307 RepID=UPI001A957A8B|nr:2'-5' RNA ligase family protein [Aridibaculum aurantiacum]